MQLESLEATKTLIKTIGSSVPRSDLAQTQTYITIKAISDKSGIPEHLVKLELMKLARQGVFKVSETSNFQKNKKPKVIIPYGLRYIYIYTSSLRVLLPLKSENFDDKTRGISTARTSIKHPVKNKPQPDRLIEFWNSLPNTRKHTQPSTKIYKQTKKLLTALKQGRFHDQCLIDPDFLKLHKIDYRLLTRKWSAKEIRNGIKNLSLIFKSGYWPRDKTNLPVNLKGLLHNPRTNTSMFLMLCLKPPRKLGDDNQSEKPLPPEVLKLFPPEDLTEQMSARLRRSIRSIYTWHRGLVSRGSQRDPVTSGTILYWFPYPENVIRDYIDWIQAQNWLNEVSISVFSTKSKLWKKYLAEQSKDLGIELR